MIFVPIWPKNDIRLEEHDFSNFLFFPDRLSVPSILLKFSDQKTGSRRVVGWHKKSEKYFGFILAAKPRLRWVPEVYVVKIYFCMKRKFLKKEF